MNGNAESIVYEIGHLPQLVWSLLQKDQTRQVLRTTRANPMPMSCEYLGQVREGFKGQRANAVRQRGGRGKAQHRVEVPAEQLRRQLKSNLHQLVHARGDTYIK